MSAKAKPPIQTESTVWKFIDDAGSFELENPGQFSRLYFPLANDSGFLSNITPKLKGSIQIGNDAFLTLPLSAEDLHSSKVSRNFWVVTSKEQVWSATGVSKNKNEYKEKVSVRAGLLWHELTRENTTLGLKSKIMNFVPSSGEHVEIMIVTIENTSSKAVEIECTASVPIYARSADNLRDHRHVTSLLNRIKLHGHGVSVTPTMTFDERGHQINELTYAVLGCDANGNKPAVLFPTVESFIGEGGSFEYPKALFESSPKDDLKHIQGKEALGGIQFKKKKLGAGESASWIILMGIANEQTELNTWTTRFGTLKKALASLEETRETWIKRSQQVFFKTHDPNFDHWLKWVGVQPVFRKIFGNSFLPDFDYGRGGRGWRDLWQDCLALLLIHPKETRPMLLHNFAGVRIDGSNATIISAGDYRFIADRNHITRVWMDHGVWPWVTTELYLHESGDVDFLLKKAPYFRDTQLSRAAKKDPIWNESYGTQLKTKSGKVYEGTLIEHVLVQHLVQFFNVGPHNHIRLENADWNDGLDMAAEKGESVAFTAFYAGNLKRIASFLEYLANVKEVRTLKLAKELGALLDVTQSGKPAYHSINYKHETLQRYFKSTQPVISGKQTSFPIERLVRDLNVKADWIFKNIREKEWIKTKSGSEFFNGYYDNAGKRVEGDSSKGLRMTLTGQVFAIMSGVAEREHIQAMVRSIRKHLKSKTTHGVHLNTDFGQIQPHLGRAFSFTYGDKENGAFFNHMQVMLANALYRQGFVEEGYEILENIHKMCVNTPVSKIYPGLPEYFNLEGRGLYHYLTGSASWYFLTLHVESFGVKGHYGDLLIAPKLVAKQFSKSKEIELSTVFADRKIKVIYENPGKLSYGEYNIERLSIDGKPMSSELNAQDAVLISRSTIRGLSENKPHEILAYLGRRKRLGIPTSRVAADPTLIERIRATSKSDQNPREPKLTALPDFSAMTFKHI